MAFNRRAPRVAVSRRTRRRVECPPCAGGVGQPGGGGVRRAGRGRRGRPRSPRRPPPVPSTVGPVVPYGAPIEPAVTPRGTRSFGTIVDCGDRGAVVPALRAAVAAQADRGAAVGRPPRRPGFGQPVRAEQRLRRPGRGQHVHRGLSERDTDPARHPEPARLERWRLLLGRRPGSERRQRCRLHLVPHHEARRSVPHRQEPCLRHRSLQRGHPGRAARVPALEQGRGRRGPGGRPLRQPLLHGPPGGRSRDPWHTGPEHPAQRGVRPALALPDQFPAAGQRPEDDRHAGRVPVDPDDHVGLLQSRRALPGLAAVQPGHGGRVGDRHRRQPCVDGPPRISRHAGTDRPALPWASIRRRPSGPSSPPIRADRGHRRGGGFDRGPVRPICPCRGRTTESSPWMPP